MPAEDSAPGRGVVETTFQIPGGLLVTLRLETDAIADAAELIRKIRDALQQRHGDDFRALGRKIEALPDSADPSIVQVLDHQTLITTPPQAWADIIAEAVRLGVI